MPVLNDATAVFLGTQQVANVYAGVNKVLPRPPVAGYVGWWDASRITGQADNTTLQTWPDLSGNGRTLSQATASNRPTYYSSTAGKTVNGLPAVWFNGTSNQMITPTATVIPVRTIFVVGKTSSVGNGTSTGATFTDGIGGSNRSMISTYTGVANTPNWSQYAGAVYNGGLAADTNLHVLGAVFNGAASVLDVDGVARPTGNPGAQSFDGLRVGATTANGFFLTGPICEVIVYPSALSASDRQAVFQYLRAKWGTAYADAVLADLPWGYWPLNGNANDMLGLHNGTPDAGVTWEAGRVGQCARIHGGVEQINVGPGDAIGAISALSLEAWFNLPAVPAAIGGLVCADSNVGVTTSNFFLRAQIAGTVRAGFYVGGVLSVCTSTAVLTNGAWHHVVATKASGGGTTVYVDGALGNPTPGASSTGNIQASATAPISLGHFGGAADAFSLNGPLDECAIYPYALSAARILAHYQAGITP